MKKTLVSNFIALCLLVPVLTFFSADTAQAEEYSADQNTLQPSLLPDYTETGYLATRAAPSTWYYSTYRSFSGIPPHTIYVSVENTAVRKVYRGYLTLQSNGYAPGNWRVYAGTLYLSGGSYPIPSRAIEDL